MAVLRAVHIVSLSLALVGSACIAEPDAADSLVAGPLVAVASAPPAVHMIPLHRGGEVVVDAAPAGAHLTNFGGPRLITIFVAPLFWNSAVQFQAQLNQFYQDIVNSPLWTMLAQYGLVHGSARPGFVDTRATANVSDRTVQTEVLNQINAGHLPPPNTNSYYPVHFPPGMSITAPDGSRSCVVFCAYHGTFQVTNSAGQIVNVNYGVIPDQGGGCAGGCGNDPSRLNNLLAVSSHELIEAATDPAVGLATVIGPPLAWYDPNNGEIGDICNGQHGTTTVNGHTYVIQLEFSNAASNCVAQ